MQEPDNNLPAATDRSFDPIEIGDAMNEWSDMTKVVMFLVFLAILIVLTPAIRERLRRKK